MLGEIEIEEIRRLIYAEMASIESRIAHQAGSYNYVCCVGGSPCFTHHPVGAVLRTIYHPEQE